VHTPPQCKETVESILRALAPRLDALITPALVLDLDLVRHNVRAMRELAGARRWRPHIKTTKHPEILRVLLDEGVSTIKCATLDELAMALDAAGERPLDVLVAYPLQHATTLAAARLTAQHPHCTVRLLIDSPTHLERTDAWLDGAPTRLSAMLDVDVGMGRTGTVAKQWTTTGARNLDLVGLHGYEGHLSWAQSEQAALGYADLVQLASRVDFEVRWVVTSGTHAFHHALADDALRSGPWQHQISPGTVVLSDLRSAPAAALVGLRQAAFVLSRVIATPSSARVTLDAGSKALNPDCPPPGCAVVGHPLLRPLAASEEHRPCETSDAVAPALGDIVALVPEHVCTTVNLYRHAQLVAGDRDLGTTDITAHSRTHDARAFALR